jgi:membrane associated rhomboid family serine protease
MAKFLIAAGLIIAGIGTIILIFQNMNIPLGRLPGDIIIKKKDFTIYIPIATSILLSIILSLIMYFLSRR